MKLHVEAGHGDGYRTPGQFDYGMFTDNGECEAAVCREYAHRLRILADARGHCANISLSGNLASRLSTAIGRKVDLLISFHLDGFVDSVTGGRILYAQDGARRIAKSLGEALLLPVDCVPADGLLRYTPSVEFRLANIASWPDMKRVASRDYCDQLCTRIVDTLDALYGPAQPRTVVAGCAAAPLPVLSPTP